MTERATCANCGEPIVLAPFFLDGRLPNPPIWSHPRAGTTCGTKSKGWQRPYWPRAQPSMQEGPPRDGATTPAPPEHFAIRRRTLPDSLRHVAEKLTELAEADGPQDLVGHALTLLSLADEAEAKADHLRSKEDWT